MNSEVAKCAVERENLHRDFGADSFASWRQEHSSVVLTEQEQVTSGTLPGTQLLIGTLPIYKEARG